MKDIRVLCKRCADDYIATGYKLIPVSKTNEKCDKCGRNGRTFEIDKNGQKAR